MDTNDRVLNVALVVVCIAVLASVAALWWTATHPHRYVIEQPPVVVTVTP